MEKYYLKQKVISFSDRYRIFDEKRVMHYHCEGKHFSIRNKMSFLKTSSKEELYRFKRILLAFLPAYYLLDANDDEVATCRRKFAFFKKVVEVKSRLGDFSVQGNFIGHNFSIERDGQEVATIQKKWISWGDSYEIVIHDDENKEFLLALVILIDTVFHNSNRKRR